MKNKFYITTPIYYVNSEPHIGSLYTTILADVISRIMKIMGKEVTFLTGSDEHGQKIFEAAAKKNIAPKNLVDNLSDVFKKAWAEWNIDYDIFMRTTDSYHIKSVQDWILKLKKQNLIYKGFYEGWYSITSESFIFEKDIELRDENGTPLCPISKKPAVWLKQESYFFKLSAFQDKLLKFYEENSKFITPNEKFEEIISFVKSGLNDLCISRSKKELSWGIPFPEDDNHVVYVWADALNNYITGIGYLQSERENEFKSNWPCDLHIMGKDISRFHAVYWPAFLMAANLELPIREMVHGWILSNNEKMSKSLGNVISPNELYEKYGPDICRYYMIRHITITHDSNFSMEDLEEKSDTELANTVGNLIQRVIVLCLKNNFNKIKFDSSFAKNESLFIESLNAISEFENEVNSKTYMLHKIYGNLWRFINSINAYLNEKEPWKIKNKDEFEKIISVVLDSIFKSATLIWPVMPNISNKILNHLGLSKENFYKINEIKKICENNYEFNLKNIENPLFKKFIESKKIMTENKTNIEIKNEPLENKAEEVKKIPFETFAAVHLLVGEIINIEEIPKSDKLYKLTVNFGQHGNKTICSGIKKYYMPNDLKNKKVVFAFNLEPRKMCGENSEGMILTAAKNGIPLILTVDSEIINGTRLS